MPAIIGSLLIAGFETAAGVEGLAGTLSVGGLTISPAVVGNAALLAGSVGLNLALAAGQKQQKPGGGLLSIKQPNPTRQGVYGCTRAALSYMLYTTVPPLGVQSIDVLAGVGGQVCGPRQFFLNDDTASLSGTVVNIQPDGRYAGASVALNWRVGLPRESAYSAAVASVPALWTADHRGDGIASLSISCLQPPNYNQFTEIFPNALPNPSFAVDGYPLYDPRFTTPPQDPDDPETWIAYPAWSSGTSYAAGNRVIFGSLSCAPAYSAGATYARYDRASFGGVDYYSRVSGNIGTTPGTDLSKWLPIGTPYYSRTDANIGNTPDTSPTLWCSVIANPILQQMDYITDPEHGMGLSRDILITPKLDNWIAKANLCDELVLEEDGTTGPRYTSNGKFNFDDDPELIFGGMGAACDIWFTEDGDGSLAIEVGVFSEPTVSIVPRQIVGWTLAYGLGNEQAINELAITFTDPSNKYQEVPGRPWRNEADISRRGRVRSQPLPLTWVQRELQARRLAQRAADRLLASHGSITLGFDGGLEALGQRWVNIVGHPYLPAVAEFSEGTIDVAAQTVTFSFVTIDARLMDDDGQLLVDDS